MHDDVTEFIEAYRDALARGASALAEFYAEPCVTAETGVARVHPTRHDVQRLLAEVDATYETRGITHGDVLAVDVKPLGSSGALATVHWAYKGACEELLSKATLSYHLSRRDGAWKILVQTTHDA